MAERPGSHRRAPLRLPCFTGSSLVPLRGRLAPGTTFPARQAAYFYAALEIFYLAEGSPLHDLAEVYLFSAHMVQHLLLSYVVALLLLLGTPAWLLRPLLLNRTVKPLAQWLTHPIAAGFIFSLFFSVWHFPAVYEAALRSNLVHHGEHLLFIGTALLMWVAAAESAARVAAPLARGSTRLPVRPTLRAVSRRRSAHLSLRRRSIPPTPLRRASLGSVR